MAEPKATQGETNFQRIIIDTDCGTDDACAILLALRVMQKSVDVRIEAITTVCGNVKLELVRPNVLRVLRLCNEVDSIPVFEGASIPLVEPFSDASAYHGTCGFGGVSHMYPSAEVPVPDEHAVNALVRLVRKYKGAISLVALGPLTNVALAQKLDPTFLESLRELIVMGGSCTGSGNDRPGAEFNFACDPEAMAIVINEMKNAEKLTIVTFDACRTNSLDWPWIDHLDDQNKFIGFIKNVMKKAFERWRNSGLPGAYIYDMSAMAVLFDSRIAAKSITCPVYPELAGRWSRGAMIMDRRNPCQWEKKASAKVVTGLDADRLKKMFDWIN